MSTDNKGKVNPPNPPKTDPKTDPKKEAPKKSKEEAKKERQEKFIELASARTRNIIKQIRILGNCSSGNYEYSQDQVNKVFGTLEEAIAKTKALFVPKDEKEAGAEKTFKL